MASLAQPATLACDVLVVGGGAAGLAAAVGAATTGVQVVLLERYGFLGGLATTAEVGTICGLYLRDSSSQTPALVGGSFGEEFASRLAQTSITKPLSLDKGLWVLPYRPTAFARTADDLLKASGNVKLILHTIVSGAKVERGVVTQVQALAWNESVQLVPRAVVDCTGEATVAALAGSEVEDCHADQAPSLVFGMEDVDPVVAQVGILEVRRALREAVETGTLPAQCERLALVPGTSGNGRLALKFNLPVTDAQQRIWEQVTDWERQARALVEQLQQFLIENTSSFRNARPGPVAAQIGIRASRRIRGRATLSDEDVLKSRKHPDGIARGSWPMERWGNALRPEMTFFSEHDYYEIPLDCLRPRELDNLFVAGRCFSATAGAMSSARVIGTALGTGWAAGTAAACRAMGKPAEQAVAKVREEWGTEG